MIETLEKPETPPISPENFTIRDILSKIPHRYPFLLVDRITAHVPGKHIAGYKNVTVNEPFFQGHFPNNPIMPGVLIVEAMAQVGCMLVKLMPEGADKLVLFAGIDKIRFRRPVVPGDKLELAGELLRLKGPLGKAAVRATVDGQMVADGTILFSLIPENAQAES